MCRLVCAFVVHKAWRRSFLRPCPFFGTESEKCLIVSFFLQNWSSYSESWRRKAWRGVMQVGTASGDVNPTSSYFNQRGIWITYVLVIFLAHLFILSMPFFSTAVAWTLTNVLHDIVSLVIISCVSRKFHQGWGSWKLFFSHQRIWHI